MTRQTFYRKLRKYAGLFKWKVDKHGCIRGTRAKRCYCPITAVCKGEFGEFVELWDADYVSLVDHDDTDLIIAAADDSTVCNKIKQDLCRKTLLRSVGIE